MRRGSFLRLCPKYKRPTKNKDVKEMWYRVHTATNSALLILLATALARASSTAEGTSSRPNTRDVRSARQSPMEPEPQHTSNTAGTAPRVAQDAIRSYNSSAQGVLTYNKEMSRCFQANITWKNASAETRSFTSRPALDGSVKQWVIADSPNKTCLKLNYRLNNNTVKWIYTSSGADPASGKLTLS